MIFEYISVFVGFIKLVLYKVLYTSRIKFNGMPIMNSSFKISTKKNAKINIGKKFRARNNISFRVYESARLNLGDNVFFNDNCSINCQENIEKPLCKMV